MDTNTHPPTRVRVPAAVLFQEIEGEAVLMHTGTETYFALDPVGTTIWKLLVETPDLEAVHASLIDVYDVSAERAEADLRAFVEQLLAARLLEPA
jgi:hypothetical protein